jgi:hypothetical protein
MSLTLFSCQHSGKSKQPYKYSKEETAQFLSDIAQNATVTITDLTEFQKQATDECLILTNYPLSEKQLEEFKLNANFYLKNKDDDISDFATYTFKEYELVNEKNEKLQFVDDGRAIYLRECGLWEYNKALCQNLAIDVRLNKNFEKLKGHIMIEFEMPGNIFGTKKKEVDIPVNISIYDKNSEQNDVH